LVRDWLPVFIALVSLLFFPLWLDDKRTNLKWELQREHHERYWKYREDVRIREQEAQREKWAAEHKQQESEIEESKQQRAAERKEREEQLRQWEAENREWEERRRRENEESKRKAEARKMRHHDFQIARKRAVRQINDLLERADRKALMGHCYMLTSSCVAECVCNAILTSTARLTSASIARRLSIDVCGMALCRVYLFSRPTGCSQWMRRDGICDMP